MPSLPSFAAPSAAHRALHRRPPLRLLVLLVLLMGGLLRRPAIRPHAVHAAIPPGVAAAEWQAIQALLPPSQQVYLKASNTEAADGFGRVAVDGDTVVVGGVERVQRGNRGRR